MHSVIKHIQLEILYQKYFFQKNKLIHLRPIFPPTYPFEKTIQEHSFSDYRIWGKNIILQRSSNPIEEITTYIWKITSFVHYLTNNISASLVSTLIFNFAEYLVQLQQLSSVFEENKVSSSPFQCIRIFMTNMYEQFLFTNTQIEKKEC